MKFIYYGKNVDLDDKLKELAEKKLGRLNKYFDNDLESNVTFSTQKELHFVEVTIFLPQHTILRAEESAYSFEDALDKAADSLYSQVRKYKTKLQRRYHKGDTIRFESLTEVHENEVKEDEEPRIVRTKNVALKPMNVEEAILQMELVDHDFFVFQEAETDEVQVVYKRKAGNYGLIKPSI